jgi:hypothetical protein
MQAYEISNHKKKNHKFQKKEKHDVSIGKSNPHKLNIESRKKRFKDGYI